MNKLIVTFSLLNIASCSFYSSKEYSTSYGNNKELEYRLAESMLTPYQGITFAVIDSLSKASLASKEKNISSHKFGKDWVAKFQYRAESDSIEVYDIDVQVQGEISEESILIKSKKDHSYNIILVYSNRQNFLKNCYLYLVDSALYPCSYYRIFNERILYKADCRYYAASDRYHSDYVFIPRVERKINLGSTFLAIDSASRTETLENVGDALFLEVYQGSMIPVWMRGINLKE